MKIIVETAEAAGATRAPAVPRQYTNTDSSCRECARTHSNLLIRSRWQQGR
jgi:hypothetical protein